MEVPYQPPNILRLTGITLNDYIPIEDIADRCLIQTLDEVVLPEMTYDKIPRVFTCIETWPHNTNLHCWQCGFTFDGSPKFVPTYVREFENTIEFGVHGNMCTFNCAELWIIINYASKEDHRWRAQDNLCLLYYLFTGNRVSRIHPAPNKTELKKYGGEIDETVFCTKIHNLNVVHCLKESTHNRISSALETICATKSVLGSHVSGSHVSGSHVSGSHVIKKNVWNVCNEQIDIPIKVLNENVFEIKHPPTRNESPASDTTNKFSDDDLYALMELI